MNTLELRGDLLNLFVALALGGVEGQDLRVPFDEWGCGIVYKGSIFSPEKDVALVWPTVMGLESALLMLGTGVGWSRYLPRPIVIPLHYPRSTAPTRLLPTVTQSYGASSALQCQTPWKLDCSAW